MAGSRRAAKPIRLTLAEDLGSVIDGAWWPHSGDLATELPDLLAVLSVRLGPIDRVMYNLGEWKSSPTRLMSGGRSVRLDGYRRQPAHTVEIAGLTGHRIVLLVIAPQADRAQAHATLMAAAHPEDDSSVAELELTGAASGAL
jgi:hypothetical protein